MLSPTHWYQYVGFDDGCPVIWEVVAAGGVAVSDEDKRFLVSGLPRVNGGGGRFPQE